MVGLYIHIPFCSKKCYYCDFVSYVKSESLMDEYVDCVLKELSLYKNVKFDTIFIGGGTPSYLDEKSFLKLLSGIQKLTVDSNILEFTVECNPGTLNYEKLKIMNCYGVNRLSIGLQSINEKTLSAIGRIHTLDDFEQSLNNALNVGFKNINADLIFSIPYESFDDYVRTLNVVINYELSHISAYNLILEENTKFYNLYKNNKFKELDEDTQSKMYEYTKYFLESNGFNQYEVSNYAKNSQKCIHNLIYWNLDDYVGIGVGAHSFFKGKRFENTRNLREYIKMINTNTHNYINEYTNSINDSIEEFVMLGFRKIDGISLKDFKNKFEKDFNEVFREQILKYKKENLLICENDRVFLSEKGICLMNFVLKDFIIE